MSWEPIIPAPGQDLWELANRCDAVYECPRDTTGKRLGPLIPYAGKDSQGRNLVGDVYFNFAKIEEQMLVVQTFANEIFRRLRLSEANLATTIVGIPDGGRTLGGEVAAATRKRFVYPMKAPRPKSPGALKDEFDFVFKRHELHEGEQVIICDDVCNNYNNTGEVLEAVAKTGAVVVGICCALNRSQEWPDKFVPCDGTYKGKEIPVIAGIKKPLPEWEVDDLEVAADMQAGNIERNVKVNWERLKQIMEKARSGN